MTLALAVAAGALIGLSLGALGGGGSILAVPVLVYLLDQSPVQATTGSLVVVGVTSLIGAVAAHREGNVLLARGVGFGAVAIGGAVGGAKASAHVSEEVLLAAFAVLMLLVGAAMAARQLRQRSAAQQRQPDSPPAEPVVSFRPRFVCRCPRALQVLVTATAVGLLTGFLGVGGGFLVVPALVLALALPMQYAAGTSLVVITLTSASALVVRAGSGLAPDWTPVLVLTAVSAVGAVLGARLAARTGTARLAGAFTALVVGVALYTSGRALPALVCPTHLTERKNTTMPVISALRTAPPDPAGPAFHPGTLGRLGGWVTDHGRLVTVVWLLLIAGLGMFAPQVEHNLSGAGWQASGSESVAARELAREHFGGNASSAIQVVVHSEDGPVTEGRGAEVLAEVTALLEDEPRVAEVVAPQPGATLSADGDTAIVLAGAGADTNEMVRVATDLKGPLQELSTDGIQVSPTGSSLLWSDFNEANLDAMLQSEMMSWPVTLAILVLAFGALVAAGLPLILTLAGLVASAGSLVLINELVPVSIWAMNFAMMFALALGIDYALFIVVRYRAARMGSHESRRQAVAETMDTAGKAVLLSGVTVLVALSAVMLVPSPAFRSMAGGIMLSVVFVLAATLTLLPLVLFKLDHRINRFALRWVHSGEHRSPRFAAWGERLWRRPVAWGLASLVILLALAAPIVGLKTAMPSIKVLPEESSARVGYDVVQEEFGAGAPGTLQVVVAADEADRATTVLGADDGIAGAMPAQPAADDSGLVLIQAVPDVDPSDPALDATVDRLRADLPDSALVGGAAVENLDLKAQLDESTPIVVAVVLVLGFVLLLLALQAPLIALLGTLVSLLSTAAAFGVARLVFQEGLGADLLGFESQGFLDAWAPVFFFAMIFAIAMDYTVFLLASAKEHYERSGDPHEAMVGAVAHSGRVIFAAGAVMVAVFFTFALSGPLPPKEMGIVLGVAVLLDAFLVRLVLLPVLLRLTGRAAWHTPAWLAKVLPDIRFAHD